MMAQIEIICLQLLTISTKTSTQAYYFWTYNRPSVLCRMKNLLSKLDDYYIRGSANKLMQSFHNRKQFLSINGINSEIERVKYGVAQGSPMTPFYFYCVLITCPVPQTVFRDFLLTTLVLLLLTVLSLPPYKM